MAAIRAKKFEIYKADDGWRWRLIASNGKIMADSGEGYVRKSSVEAAVRSIRDAPTKVVEK